MAKVPFPDIPFGEFTVVRPHTAPGLFAYRHMQAINLLSFPDLSDGDFTREQRKEALTQFVNVYRPLAALVIFLNVVALEDFVRDLGARLADLPDLASYVPLAADLGPTQSSPQRHRPFARLDKDAAQFSDFREVNRLYQRVLGVQPFPDESLARLSDLALIRHTVAHHAARVRPIDVARFQTWEFLPNQLINPPVNVVRDLCGFIWRSGELFEKSVRTAIFGNVIPRLQTDWAAAVPPILNALIETFNYFGKLPDDDPASPETWALGHEDQLRRCHAARRAELVRRCVEDLLVETWHASP